MDIKTRIQSLCKNVYFDEEMKNHTTFKIGGKADIFCEPENEQEIINLLKFLNNEKINYIILGNGSNVLVSDDGIRDVVIHIGDRMTDVEIKDNLVYVQGGILLSRLSKLVAKEGLSGMELISGIPGTIGGAIYMNAGAYGAEIKDILKEVTYITSDGILKTQGVEDLELGYRKSIFTNNNAIIVSCVLKLERKDTDEILKDMADITKRRVEKQPLELPSAGSTFKRPDGYFAGKLIEDCNLKGYSIGGAMVSQKHAGFVVNYNNATADDVKTLIKHIQTTVYKKFGVNIEPEIKFLG